MEMINPLMTAYLRNLLREAVLEKLGFTILFALVFYEIWFRIYGHIDRIFIFVFVYVNMIGFDALFANLLNHFKNELKVYLLHPCSIRRLIMFKIIFLLLIWLVNLAVIMAVTAWRSHADPRLLLTCNLLLLPWVITAALLSSSAGVSSRSSTWPPRLFNLLMLVMVIIAFRIGSAPGQILFFMAGLALTVFSLSVLKNAAKRYEWS